jgi:hypothetical protein
MKIAAEEPCAIVQRECLIDIHNALPMPLGLYLFIVQHGHAASAVHKDCGLAAPL